VAASALVAVTSHVCQQLVSNPASRDLATPHAPGQDHGSHLRFGRAAEGPV